MFQFLSMLDKYLGTMHLNATALQFDIADNHPIIRSVSKDQPKYNRACVLDAVYSCTVNKRTQKIKCIL